MRKPSERLKSSITTENLWLYILKMLKKPCYAYEMDEILSTPLTKLKAKKMTIYSVFYKLELGGYIKKIFKKRASGPDRKYYIITGKGRKELANGKKLLENLLRLLD